ncbi:MAG: hypothetical protein JO057_10725 [Chloroflexi bacterium]|nr:hypothetical protein [Chloroflexota bacterium]
MPVVSEIIRVLKSGGRVVAVEPDLALVLIDSGVADVTRKVLAMQAGAYRNASAGRQLRRLLSQAGLVDVRAVPQVMTIPDAAMLGTMLRLFSVARAGVATGAFRKTKLQHGKRICSRRTVPASSVATR